MNTLIKSSYNDSGVTISPRRRKNGYEEKNYCTNSLNIATYEESKKIFLDNYIMNYFDNFKQNKTNFFEKIKNESKYILELDGSFTSNGNFILIKEIVFNNAIDVLKDIIDSCFDIIDLNNVDLYLQPGIKGDIYIFIENKERVLLIDIFEYLDLSKYSISYKKDGVLKTQYGDYDFSIIENYILKFFK